MRRTISLSIASLAVCASLSFAQPISVRVVDGLAIVELEGAYVGSYYNAFRADDPQGEYRPVLGATTLCTGACYVVDFDALPGRTYFYRFELDGGSASDTRYGPQAVTIPGDAFSGLTTRVSPNPSRGPATIELRLAGRFSDPSVPIEAGLYDVQGRLVRTIHRGALPRGLTSLRWDGRGDRGNDLGTGLFLLRVRGDLGQSVSRVIRIR
jgi:hypothetical protein